MKYKDKKSISDKTAEHKKYVFMVIFIQDLTVGTNVCHENSLFASTCPSNSSLNMNLKVEFIKGKFNVSTVLSSTFIQNISGSIVMQK